jgi:hypothetical protein
MDNYKVITIKCLYAYDGVEPGETYEKRNEHSLEKWEISLGHYKKGYCIILKNIDQGFTEAIDINKDAYDKICLGQEPDMAVYLRTAYQTHREVKSNK